MTPGYLVDLDVAQEVTGVGQEPGLELVCDTRGELGAQTVRLEAVGSVGKVLGGAASLISRLTGILKTKWVVDAYSARRGLRPRDASGSLMPLSPPRSPQLKKQGREAKPIPNKAVQEMGRKAFCCNR